MFISRILRLPPPRHQNDCTVHLDLLIHFRRLSASNLPNSPYAHELQRPAMLKDSMYRHMSILNLQTEVSRGGHQIHMQHGRKWLFFDRQFIREDLHTNLDIITSMSMNQSRRGDPRFYTMRVSILYIKRHRQIQARLYQNDRRPQIIGIDAKFCPLG